MSEPFQEATTPPIGAPSAGGAPAPAEPAQSTRAGIVGAGAGMMSAAVLAITNPKPKKKKTTKTLIVEGGIWKPFYIWPKREKISEARKKYHEASELFDDLQLEAERTKASLEFLCAQVADGERRLKAISAARTRAAEDAKKHLLHMAEGS